MKILFFDATNSWILVYSFQVDRNFQELYKFGGNFPKEASTRLVLELKNSLTSVQWKKPDILVTCLGPGSFSGIRISVSTAKSLSQIWKIPVYGVDSLELYSSFYFQLEKKRVLTSICGNKNTRKSYLGIFDKNGFEGSFENSKENIKDFENLICYTDDVEFLKGKKIQTHLPSPMVWIKKNLSILHHLSYEKNHYQTITPNYIRFSYFEK